MRRLIASVLILSAFALVATGATIHVVPHPGPGEISLKTALELAQPGDEIALAPGSYSGEFTIDKSVQIQGETGTEVIPGGYSEVAFTITSGRVVLAGVALKGGDTGMKVTGNADLTVDRCQFSGLKTGVHLADGRGKITNSRRSEEHTSELQSH